MRSVVVTFGVFVVPGQALCGGHGQLCLDLRKLKDIAREIPSSTIRLWHQHLIDWDLVDLA